MRYVFDPDNWEWLITGNNARYIIEGFLINLEIAIIAMILSLFVGLALALLRLSATGSCRSWRGCGSTSSATCR